MDIREYNKKVFEAIKKALERKGQVILHGPPGTGKTYHALRFAEEWLASSTGSSRTIADMTAQQTPRRIWWMVASLTGKYGWHWNSLFSSGSQHFHLGRVRRHYPLVQKGDLVIGYQAAHDQRICALAEIAEGLHTVSGEQVITIKPLHSIATGPSFADLSSDPNLKGSEPIRHNCRGTLFKLEEDEAKHLLDMLVDRAPSEDEAEHLLDMLVDRDPSVAKFIGPTTETQPQLTLVSFHPTYSYEDFIEGFRPQDTGEGLRLQLTDGLFKTVCRAAQINPDQTYLIIIDEINRANLSKVFGEIITLLERDKRDVKVFLPQSKEQFSIPKNVYMLGTMNTSDRSIQLMDAALRRRFSFIELMPQLELLKGPLIGGKLNLYTFLQQLNDRISQKYGRDKQIGHAFFLDNNKPVSDVEKFAQIFRQDILPLLQEYYYGDYEELDEYIGNAMNDPDDDDKLVDALA